MGHGRSVPKAPEYKAWLASAALVATGACGARTGLDTPDAPLDVRDATFVDEAAPDVSTHCINGEFTLTARAADVILVLDRSGSMADGINGMRAPAGMSKWSLLSDALASTLPMFQDRIDVGALMFPSVDAGGTAMATCALANIPDVDVDPGVGQWSSVVQLLQTTSPGGDTPTNAALIRAYDWFVRHPNRARSQYLVLATDGAPNCNAGLDPMTCICTTGTHAMMGCGSRGSALSCLDETRTVSTIAQMESNPIASIPTFVIGIGAAADPVFTAALDAMAIAGGRPNAAATDAGGASFYDVEQPGDLALAFTAIQSTIARCSFVTPSRPDTPNGLTLSVDGMTVLRDPTHVNGWDWTDAAYGEITLFGPACEEALSTEAMPLVTVACAGSDL